MLLAHHLCLIFYPDNSECSWEEVVSGTAALVAFSAFFPAALRSFAQLLSPVVGLKP